MPPRAHQTIWEYQPKSHAAEDYDRFVDGVRQDLLSDRVVA